jgi:hypothetical protein
VISALVEAPLNLFFLPIGDFLLLFEVEEIGELFVLLHLIIRLIKAIYIKQADIILQWIRQNSRKQMSEMHKSGPPDALPAQPQPSRHQQPVRQRKNEPF